MTQAFHLVEEANGETQPQKTLDKGKLKVLSGFIQELFRYGDIVKKEVTCDYSE